MESGSDLLDLGRHKVHLVSVSKFSEKGEVVLVNMKTFETKVVNFG